MYRVSELKSDVDRLYLPREMGGRGLISVWDSFQSSSLRIAHALINTDNEILRQCVNIEKMRRALINSETKIIDQEVRDIYVPKLQSMDL